MSLGVKVRSLWWLAAPLLVGCSGPDLADPASEPRCPVPNSEFPPTACAIVRGVAMTPDGRLLSQLPIRVDSGHPATGYHYTSGPAMTGQDGSFELLVHRDLILASVTNPDTARVEIKAYSTAPPRPQDPAIARAPVLMHFAPLGQPVKPSVVVARFAIP